jgi:thiamine phosphate synthase YjbQ (UPF0047 family)
MKMAGGNDFYRRYFGMEEEEAIEYLERNTRDKQHGKYLREAVQHMVKAESSSTGLPATALGHVCSAIASAELARKFGVGADITDMFIEAATRKKQELHDQLDHISMKSV